MLKIMKWQYAVLLIVMVFALLGTFYYVKPVGRDYTVLYIFHKDFPESGNGIVKEMDDKRNNAIQVTETASVHMSANKESTYTTTIESTERPSRKSTDRTTTIFSLSSSTITQSSTSTAMEFSNTSDIKFINSSSDSEVLSKLAKSKENGLYDIPKINKVSNLDSSKSHEYRRPETRSQAEQILRDSINNHHLENFVKPQNESCRRRFPTCMVVGVAKSGTREIMDFMRLHPHIEIYLRKKTYENPYFGKYYRKGKEWLKSQMPCSYSNQVTIIKNAWYFHNSYIPERIQKFDKNMKLIVLVREPVSRAISHFSFMRHGRNRSFEDVLKGNTVNANLPCVYRSVYDKPMKNWLKYFSLEQFLIIDSAELKFNPPAVMAKVEDFLGLEHYITPEMFVLDEKKGYYCIQSNLTENGMACYGSDRGREPIQVKPKTISKLKEYFKPKTERFFSIIGKSFNWK